MPSFCALRIAEKDSFIIYRGFKKYSPDDSFYITSTGEGDFDLNYKLTFDKDSCLCEYSTDNARLGAFSLFENNVTYETAQIPEL